MSSKNKQQTEIQPIEAEIMSDETLGIDAPGIIEAEEQGDKYNAPDPKIAIDKGIIQ